MGYRTLSLRLVLLALFLDDDAYDRLRDDDNPFVEGLFLIVLISLGTALLAAVGELLAWASVPNVGAIKEVIGNALQQMPWWSAMAAEPRALQGFQQTWELAWRVFPPLFGAPSPATAAANILLWPLSLLLSWLVYGLLAHLFAKLLDGSGSLSQTLGSTALAWAPWVFYGLQVIPFLVLGGFISTWQLICRYKAVRSAHGLPWQRAFWATVLPFAVYLAITLVVGGVVAAVTALVVAGVGGGS